MSGLFIAPMGVGLGLALAPRSSLAPNLLQLPMVDETRIKTLSW